MDITLNNKSLEKQQNISFHIKNLPNELINYVFSYVSLVPFDKKEFIMYITNHKAYYINTELYNLYGFDRLVFDKNDWYFNNTPLSYEDYISRTRINENILKYEFSTKYEPKTKEQMYNTYITKMTFMNDVMKCKSFNKSQCYNRIRKEISKDIVKDIVLENNLSNRSISRLKLDELRTILFTYLYRYN
jgi:hypothetical protein